MKKLNIAMLSEQVPISPEHEEITGGIVEDTDTGSTLDELRIAMQDLEHIDEVIDEAVGTASELMDEEAAAQQVRQQQEGVSQPALEALQRNVNGLMKQVGFESRASFALNSYANKRYNKVALESAIDTIKDVIKKIWDAIMSAINKTVEFVKGILKHFFDLSLKIKNEAEAVKRVAESKKGKVHRSVEKVGSFSLSKYVRFDGKALEPSDVLLNLDKWTSHNYNFINSIAGKAAIDEYSDYTRKAAVYAAKKLTTEPDVNEIKRETDALGDLMIKRIISNFDNHKNDIHTTKPYIGDVFYKFDEKNLSFSIEEVEGYKVLGNENTHTPLNADQVVELSDKISAHMKEYENIEKMFDELDKFKRSLNHLASEAITSKGELDAVQRKVVSEGVSFTIRIFVRAINKVGVGAREYDLQMCKALTHWCSLSMGIL